MKKNMIKKGTMDRIELSADLLDGITGGEWGYYVGSDGIPCRTDGKRLVPMTHRRAATVPSLHLRANPILRLCGGGLLRTGGCSEK